VARRSHATPSLKSLAPGQAWGNHLNGVQWRGGAGVLGLMQYWAQSAIALEILFRRYREEPERIEQSLPALVGSIDTLLAGGGYDALPLADLPDPDDLTPFVRGGFGRGVDHEIWDHLNIDGKYEQVEAPTFHIGGWYDCFLGDTLRQYEAMKQRAQRMGMRPPRLLVGPWTHGSFESTVGDLDFGIASSGGFLNYRGDLTDAQLRWFDATLKGAEEALEESPPVQVFVIGENRWRGYEEWPVPGSYSERWYLSTGGLLSREKPAQSEPDTYDYDPRAPVATIGGAVLMAPIHRPGARDQRPNEERPDVLVYTSEVLQCDYTVLGPVHATIFAASSTPDTDFVARLVDVHPDGRAIVVTDGIIRASAQELSGARRREPCKADSHRAGAGLRVLRGPVGDRALVHGRPPDTGGDHLQLLPALGAQPEHRRERFTLRAHRGGPTEDLPRPRAPEPRHADRRGQIEERR
jgi:putative CocE/NonD family hydrolase